MAMGSVGGFGVRWSLAGVFLVGGILGCGGSGGSGGQGSSGAGSTDLRVLGSTPMSAASNVDRGTQITVQFDRLLDSFTVTPSAFSVASAGPIPGDTQVAGDSIVFTPDDPLDVLAVHRVRMTEAIRSTAGDRLPAATTIQFLTREGSWAVPESLPTNATLTGLASTSVGESVALRFRTASPWSDLIVSRQAPGSTWEPEATLFADGSVAFARVALDATGWGVVVAKRSAGGNSFATWTRERTDAGQWEPAIEAAPLDSGFGEPQLVIVEPGLAVLSWRRNASSEVCASVFSAGGSWSAPLRLSADGVDADSPALASDGRGSALLVWREDSQRLHAARYTAAAGWTASQLVHTEFVCCVSAPAVSLAAGERSLVAFEADGNVYAASYQSAASTWGAAATVSGVGCGGIVSRIRVASNDEGRALVTWHCDSELWSATAAPGAAWSAPLMLGDTGPTADSVTSLDRNGNASVLWSREPSPGAARNIVIRRRVPSQPWGPMGVISSPTRCAVSPRLATLPNGSLRAVWTYTINCDFSQGRGSEGAVFD